MTEVEIRLVRKDALAAARLHHLAYLCGRFCAIVTASLAIAYAALAYVALGRNGVAMQVALSGALAVVVTLYGFLLIRHAILPVLVVRREFMERKGIREPFRISWSERGYRAHSATVQSDVPWGDYWRWRENRHVLLLYLSSRSYQLVPKAMLPPGAVEQIRAHLTEAGVKRASVFLS